MYFAIYLNFFVYVYVKFNDTIKKTTLKWLLSTAIIGALQMIIYLPMGFLSYVIPNESIIVLLINFTILLILFLTRKSEKYIQIIQFCENRDWIMKICMIICTLILVYFMFLLKKEQVIEVDLFILISIIIVMVFVIMYRWQKSIYELEQKEREMKITNLYNDVFGELIETTRRRQHDFHNQIDAIYGMHLTATTLDELVEMQKEYCDALVYENRYTKVLGCTNNSTLAGFLYTKFIHAEKYGIKIDYNVGYTENTSITVYDLVEIIGILMDNAIEYLENSQLTKKIIFDLKDFEGLDLSIKNPIQNISNNDVAQFFKKGFTTKETGSGIGLSKIKEYQKKYNYDICVEITQGEANEWIEIRIVENM